MLENEHENKYNVFSVVTRDAVTFTEMKKNATKLHVYPNFPRPLAASARPNLSSTTTTTRHHHPARFDNHQHHPHHHQSTNILLGWSPDDFVFDKTQI